MYLLLCVFNAVLSLFTVIVGCCASFSRLAAAASEWRAALVRKSFVGSVHVPLFGKILDVITVFILHTPYNLFRKVPLVHVQVLRLVIDASWAGQGKDMRRFQRDAVRIFRILT